MCEGDDDDDDGSGDGRNGGRAVRHGEGVCLKLDGSGKFLKVRPYHEGYLSEEKREPCR